MNGNTKKKSSAKGGAKAAALGLCALALVFGFAPAGCDNGTDPGGDGDPPKTVAAEYRFTNTTTGFTLGENTAVKTGDGAFSLTGVYTEGGGTFTEDTANGKWAYLYDNTGKKGFVLKFTSGDGHIEVHLGSNLVAALISEVTFTPPLSADGMSSAPEFSGGGDGGGDKTYALGDTGPGGGKIFYVSTEGFIMTDTNTTAHYLEAAPADISETKAWATSSYGSTSISGTGTAIGTGRKNTALILTTDTAAPAALACKDLTTGDKNDWFLPSKDELNALHTNRSRVENLGTYYYWSSSQDYDFSTNAWVRSGNNEGSYNKHGPESVRAVRAF
jgi:hypothetical protein